MTWNKAFVWGWVAILGILITYELYAVCTHSNDPPLTDVTLKYIPWWLVMPFLTWLWLHFGTQYKYPSWLHRIIGG